MLISVRKNPVPIGFTYFQLPHEKEPGQICPGLTRKESTSDYVGLFFRASSGEAAQFGEVQQYNTSRLL